MLVNTPLTEPLGLSLLKLSACAAVLLPASILILSAAVRAGQRRATIIEY
jgi:hypothetical protein